MSEADYCRMLAEIEVGILEPYFVDVPDGYYTKRIVWHPRYDDSPRMMTMAEMSDPANIRCPEEGREKDWHYEPCSVPRFKQELRYRRTQ